MLTAALTAAAAPRRRTPADATPGGPSRRRTRTRDRSVRAALTAVLAGAAPTARAALAVRHWWDEPPALVAACSTSDPDTVRAGLATLEQQLAAAHAEAVGRDEDEVGWALAAAVADALEGVVDDAPVADPVALVAESHTRDSPPPHPPGRRRCRPGARGGGRGERVRLDRPGRRPADRHRRPTTRRGPSSRPGPRAAPSSTTRPSGPSPPTPTRSTPRRGCSTPGPVGDTLAVVMTAQPGANPALPDGVPGPALGEGFDKAGRSSGCGPPPRRLGAGALAPTAIEGEPTARTSDLVALSVDQDTAGAPPTMLVLTRPSVTDGFVVTGAVPQPDGSVRPVVVGLPLVDGVATFAPTGVGFTPEVGVAGYRGLPAGALTNSFLLPSSGPADELAAAQRILLAGVTGHRPDSLATTSVLEAVVPASAVDPDYVGTYPDFVGTHPEPLRVTVVTTTTRDGARVRTSRLAGLDR